MSTPGAGRGRGRGVIPMTDPKTPTTPEERVEDIAATSTVAAGSSKVGPHGLERGIRTPTPDGAGAAGAPLQPGIGGGHGPQVEAQVPSGQGQQESVGPVQGQAPPVLQQLPGQPAADPLQEGTQALPAAMEAVAIGEEGHGIGRGRGRGRGRGTMIAESEQDATVGLTSSGSSKPTELTRLSGEKISDPSVLPSDGVKVEPGKSASGSGSGPAKSDTPAKPEPKVPFEPMRGGKGIKVLVTTNFLRLDIAEKMGVFEYRVDFQPQFDSIAACKKIVHRLQEELGPTRTFDGATLCLPKRLPDDTTIFEGENPNEPGAKVKVIVKYVKQQDLEKSAQFYNILLRRVLEMSDLKEINRNYFDANNIHSMPEYRLEIWRGYETAIDRYDGGLMVCVETLHRVLRNTTILEYLRSLRNSKPDWQEKFREAIVGRSVLTRYNNKFYRIDDIDWTSNPGHTFTLKKSGQEISFRDYFAKQYAAVISDMAQPMLISRIKPRKNDPTGEEKIVMLAPELSYMTGLTEDITSNFTIMKDLIARTRISPMERLKHMNEFIKRVTNCEDGCRLLASWGISLNPEPVEMAGREVEGPGIRFNDRTLKQGPDDNTFARQATSAPCFRPMGYKRWMIFAPQQEAEKVRKMIEMFKGVVGQLGITYTEPQVVTVKGSGRFLNGNDYGKCLRECAQPDEVQFVVVILSQQRDELYSAVKKQCLVNTSVPSQVILAKTLSNEKRLRSIMQKVVLQINCKLGGAIWGLEIPKNLKIMFVGIDAYHDPRRKNRSVIAMVAGMDNECSYHFSKMAFQTAHQEGSAVIGPLFYNCLTAYREFQKCLPDRILVFRDGVGDGQMKELRRQEIEPIQKILKERYPNDQKPKFSYIVVQKRINERIYKTLSARNMDNPKQGTVVDHTITRFERYDFFLISQLVRQGTVGPTHYTVLEDSDEKKPDLLQKFAYSLTFMYYNWPGTIRVPTVCQYAHKLAYLVGQHLMAEPKQESDNKLFYL